MTTKPIHYVVHVSGGLTSFWAWKLALAKAGTENVTAYFADTKGKKDADNPHAGEDQDSYRFLKDITKHLNAKLYRVADGRHIWEVMRDRRVIVMGANNAMASCSRVLKVELLDKIIAERHKDQTIIEVFGMQWYETHRMFRLIQAKNNQCWFPLADPPFIEKDQIAEYLKQHNIAVPRIYDLGFEHNNCGGFCVRAGFAHFARLYYTMPDRYLYHENKEAELIEYLGKNITILRRRVNKVWYRVTLKEFRLELEAGITKYDPNDYGACGCYVGGYDDKETI